MANQIPPECLQVGLGDPGLSYGCTEISTLPVCFLTSVTADSTGGIGMAKDVAEWVQSCLICQQKKAPERQEDPIRGHVTTCKTMKIHSS